MSKGKRQLTAAEIAAYRDLSKAAAKLQQAQEKAILAAESGQKQQTRQRR